MANTKSAERRARNSERKRLRNRSIKSRLHKLEKNFLTAAEGGQKAEATKAFTSACSAFDKAAKSGVVTKATANRKKSRLAARLNKVK